MVKVTENTSAAYGYWPSHISAELVATQGVKISEPQTTGERLFWLETRPQEAGRTALVCEYNGQRTDLLPSPLSVRTRAHEYGGGAYLAITDSVFYVLDRDQCIYHYDLASMTAASLTPEGAYRYADFCFDTSRNRLIAIREDYASPHLHFPSSNIIAIDLVTLDIHILVEGADFYSNPRLSPDGSRLSYLQWNHPQMPWDGTECVIAEVDRSGKIIFQKIIAGGMNESIFQPQWSPQGELFLVSDRSNWWNLYRCTGTTLEHIFEKQAEFSTPQWMFGMSTFGFLNAHEIFCCFAQSGQWQLGIINLNKPFSQRLATIPTDFSDISSINCKENHAYFIAASATQTARLWCWDGRKKYPKPFFSVTNSAYDLDTEFISSAQPISFPTSDQNTCYGFYYAPVNPNSKNVTNPLPPLIVICHGGPTGATETSLNLKLQFWTTRGFAVLDVNYRGSTGYGRHYREQLKNNWGIADVMDVCNGVDYLVKRQLVDKNKVAIRGSSAGGYTVLAALTFGEKYTGKQYFKTGASLYGIGDLEALAKETHKFEAHYLDSLIGKYPQEQSTYRARSPIHHVGQLNCPVIFFQGLQDKVVPPTQAEAMIAALQNKGIFTQYVAFENEGHGFRDAKNIEHALNEELNFYLTVFASQSGE